MKKERVGHLLAPLGLAVVLLALTLGGALAVCQSESCCCAAANGGSSADGGRDGGSLGGKSAREG
jgi:hypothetical protein